MKFVKKLIVVVTGSFLTLSLCSCSGSSTSVAEQTEQSNESTVTVTEENVGKSINEIAVVTSENAVKTDSKQFKAYKKDIEDFVAENGTFSGYEYSRITNNDSGIVIEIADPKLCESVIKGTAAKSTELYSAWKTMMDILSGLSGTVSEAGSENMKKPVDCSIYVLNIHNKDLVLGYAANGNVVYDVMNELDPAGYANAEISQREKDDSKPNNAKNDKETAKETDKPKTSGGSAQQTAALGRALDYLSTMPFSHDGLVDQLEYEGFSHSDAVYAADNCAADWKQQAYYKALDYLDFMAFSHDGLVDQLEYDGFTHSEAVYGADNCGADWYYQAEKKAGEYLDFMSMSTSELIDQLEYDGFTYDQARHGAEKAK